MTNAEGAHPRDLLSPYLDDELGVEDRLAVDRHLAACEDCRVELEGLQTLARALADDSVPSPPVDLLARIGRALDGALSNPSRRFRYAIPATIAATLGAVGLLVALQWREGGLGTPPLIPPALKDVRAERQAADDLKTEYAPPPTAAPPAPAPPASAPPVAAPSVAEPSAVEPRDQEARPESKDGWRADAQKEKELDQPVQPTLDEAAQLRGNNAVSGGAAGAVAPPPDEAAGARERDFATKVAAGSAMPATAAGLEASSPCQDNWSDSGVSGTWDVADVAGAANVLERIARDGGGVGIGRFIRDGRPYVIAVPWDRFAGVLEALRARGVVGLNAFKAPAQGDRCAGISVALRALPPPDSPSPR